MEVNHRPHFLVVTYPAQGHINPTLRLAKRLARISDARITFSTALSAHRRMFPSSRDQQVQLQNDDLFTCIPYSDGYDDGFDPKNHDFGDYMLQCRQQGSRSLSSVVDSLAASGHPVTCIVYSFFMSWVADVGWDRGIPSFLYWIQPVTVFAIYWHYFHDYNSIIAAHAGDPNAAISLPCLPLMRIRDLPDFITAESPDSPDSRYGLVLQAIKEMFDTLDGEFEKQGRTPRVLANTAYELEASAVASVVDKVELVGVGPLLEDASEGCMFKASEEKGYMEWLDGQAEGSVVYVSFGSLTVLKKEQMEEIWRGLVESGRPYLWVVREDNRWEGLELTLEGKGMVVAWCEQGKVLGHQSVGCFVTHCGWNSTVESLLCGVPTVAVPQWTDQTTNSWLMEREWGTGVRVEVGKEGLVEADELRRCVEMVLGEGEKGEEMRRKAMMWREKARKATGEEGSSCVNLMAIVEEMVGL